LLRFYTKMWNLGVTELISYRCPGLAARRVFTDSRYATCSEIFAPKIIVVTSVPLKANA
jgi:hypothetical protein